MRRAVPKIASAAACKAVFAGTAAHKFLQPPRTARTTPHCPAPSDFSTIAAESAGRQYRAVRRFLLPMAGLRPQRQDDGGDGNREVNCKSSTMNIISNSGRTPDAAGEWRRRAAGSTAEGSPRAHPPTAPSTETLPEQHRQIANLSNRTARNPSPIGEKELVRPLLREVAG